MNEFDQLVIEYADRGLIEIQVSRPPDNQSVFKWRITPVNHSHEPFRCFSGEVVTNTTSLINPVEYSINEACATLREMVAQWQEEPPKVKVEGWGQGYNINSFTIEQMDKTKKAMVRHMVKNMEARLSLLSDPHRFPENMGSTVNVPELKDK